MKRFIRALARRAGFIVATTGHSSARYIEYPPRGPFDEILLRVFPDLHGLSFIQIGANDGVRGDPINRYVTTCEWSGVLVEPDPALFGALKVNYLIHSRRLHFLNAAIDAQAGERLLHKIAPETPGIPDWTRGTVSFDLSHVQRVCASLGLAEGCISSSPVRTATWDEVRGLFGSRHCDVVVVDVEGYDAKLLRLAGLAQMRPTVVQFEHGCLERAERLAFYGELLDLGYELASSGIDTIAYLPGRDTSGAKP
jgi:FkbM family methyltransferase